MQFTEFNLHPEVLAGVEDAGFKTCTEVQAKTLAHSLQPKDVAVQSQTGTGKTAAFVLTILHVFKTNPSFAGAKALVITPTRELAVQIENDAKLLGSHTGFRVGCIYGGVGYGPQREMLDRGVDILVVTPGRLLDFARNREIDLREMKVVVVDEADRLFDMGFYPDLRRILRQTAPREERLTMLFSATLGTKVKNIAWEYMNDPVEIAITPEHLTVEKVEQRLYHVSKNEKMKLLLGLLAREKPEQALIFTNTKSGAEEVAGRLEINGYKSRFIMGDLPQKKRLRLIEDLKEGKLQYLVATDVAARGLHVDDLEMVINYDLPEDPENYVHRIGRTARAGRSGKAVAFACERFVYGLEAIESLIDMKIPTEPVRDEDLAEDRSAGQRIHRMKRERLAGDDGRRRDGRRDSRRDGRREVRGAEHHGAEAKRPGPGPRSEHHRSDRQRRGPGPHGVSPKVAESAGKGRKSAGKSRSVSLEERLKYYEEKYGERFSPDDAKRSGKAQESKARKNRQRPSQPTEGRPEPEPRPEPRKEKAALANDPKAKGGAKGVFSRLKKLFSGDR
ncbi:MAG: DEAD/DEAH box helicase [Spirochaetaceae bacterium]